MPGVERSEPQTSGSDVHLSLIGGFDLSYRGLPVQLRPRGERLIAFLALHGRPVYREHVAGSLWPDRRDTRAMANLRTTLWRIRGLGCPVMRELGHQLALAPAVGVDVEELTDVAHRLFDGGEVSAAPWLLQVAQMGELLPGWDEDWVLVEREHVRQVRLHVLELLCERLTEAGQFGRAVEACLAAVAGEPLRESAQRGLIKVYLAEGNAGDALSQFRSYRQLIHEELGLEPSAEIESLVHDLMLH